MQLAALVLLPLLGLKALLVGAALIDIVIGALLLSLAGTAGRPARLLAMSPVMAVLVVLVSAWSSPFDQRLMHGGVFRTGRVVNPGDWVMMYHRDGRTASRATSTAEKNAFAAKISRRRRSRYPKWRSMAVVNVG